MPSISDTKDTDNTARISGGIIDSERLKTDLDYCRKIIREGRLFDAFQETATRQIEPNINAFLVAANNKPVNDILAEGEAKLPASLFDHIADNISQEEAREFSPLRQAMNECGINVDHAVQSAVQTTVIALVTRSGIALRITN